MADFQLSDGANTFDFDIAGNVSQSGTSIGTWKVNSDNTIGIARTAGGASNITVDWASMPITNSNCASPARSISTLMATTKSGPISRSITQS